LEKSIKERWPVKRRSLKIKTFPPQNMKMSKTYEKKDKAYDKKNGIKEGSKKDTDMKMPNLKKQAKSLRK
jgi:hypothetical protein